MHQIDVSLGASEQLARVAGLSRLIPRQLAGIGETAEQMLILQGGFFPGPSVLLSVEARGAPGALHGVRGPLHRRTA